MKPTKVRVLPDELIDQIAAGEVVERPASMAKELVENALDAGATRISIRFQEGGVAELSVSDDGSGMSPDDVEMAVRRHATSKISTLDELLRVRSFGFRGEALASIASVSELSVASRDEDHESGYAVDIRGGTRAGSRPVGMARGTTVTVRDLFFNVPARRKFLKSTATEAGHLVDVVTALALTAPEVHIELVRDGRAALSLPAQADDGARAAQVFANRTLVPVRVERGPLTLSAWISNTPATHGRDLWVFVNRRWVRDRVLARAVADALKDTLSPGLFPAGVVHVQIDPTLVDVNVHPQKTEVRFADPRTVYELLSRELGDRLRQRAGVAVTPFAPPRTLEPRKKFSASSARPAQVARYVAPSRTTSSLPLREPDARPPAPPSAPPARSTFYQQLRYLGRSGATYILCEGDDALYVLDARAMKERALAKPGVSAADTQAAAEMPAEGLSPAEVRHLLDVLDGCDFSLPCVHGRPVLFRIGHDELARRAGAP